MESQQKTQLTSEGRQAGHTKEIGSTSEAALHENNSMNMTDLSTSFGDYAKCPKYCSLEHSTFSPHYSSGAAWLMLLLVG